MELLENELYLRDLERVAKLPLDWRRLSGKSLLVTGACGMIGSFLIDVLMHAGVDCRICAAGRNADRARRRFKAYFGRDNFEFIACDINSGAGALNKRFDYIFHLASNTHPLAYSADPVGTVTTNIIGLNNLLSFAAENTCERFVFASSVEVYGENRGDAEAFGEDYCGYIDCNTLRAGYPESKRCGEALCQAYIRQKGLDVVIPRLARVYGPTMLPTDTKALSQFILKAVAGEDIVLKSKGDQFFSYVYVADAVSALLYILLNGENGSAYNVSDVGSDVKLRDLAQLAAAQSGGKVVFEIPDEAERAGYSKATKAVLCSKKLQSLGWNALYNIDEGVGRTVKILKSLS